MRAKPFSALKIVSELIEKSGFRIPPPPVGAGVAGWVQPNSLVTIAGRKIACGLMYVGTTLKNVQGWNDPALIDPAKSVVGRGGMGRSLVGHFVPDYSQFSPATRGAYLDWLAGGRNLAHVPVTFLMLFFYGLERRVIFDATQTPALRAEFPVIEQELRRLLALHESNEYDTFSYYAKSLLEWIALSQPPSDKFYLQPPPAYQELRQYRYDYEPFPISLLLSLGQATVDKAPIPAAWAFAWATVHPKVSIRSLVQRDFDKFKTMFEVVYRTQHGAGITLLPNKTPLKFVYRPASHGMAGLKEIKLSFGKIPDVSSKRSPINQLQIIIDLATDALMPYYRHIGKYADQKNALAAALLLPPVLLPDTLKQALQQLQTRVADAEIILPFAALLQSLQCAYGLNKNSTMRLNELLKAQHIGIEPDVLHAGKSPEADDLVVLFAQSEATDCSTPAYLAAQLTLKLSILVAKADDSDYTAALDYVRQQLQSWTHLTPDHQRRLSAQLSLLPQQKLTLAAIKKQVVALTLPARSSIATFLAVVAQSDGSVSPAKIKLLEKIYKALDLDTNQVFSDLHAAESGTVSHRQLEQTGFTLDAERIVVLQRDTARVSRLLADIFNEDQPVAPAPVVEPSHASIMGLDEIHSTLARRLLARPEWTRAELLAAVADLNLMLDGALEHLNDAAFDAFDCPFAEGDDPITLSPEILESLTL